MTERSISKQDKHDIGFGAYLIAKALRVGPRSNRRMSDEILAKAVGDEGNYQELARRIGKAVRESQQ